MLDARRRVNKNKILKVNSPIDKIEVENLAKLKQEKEVLERGNIEASKSLDSKRRSLNLDYKSCQKIEKEHFDKVDKAQAEYLDLTDKFDQKNLEFIEISDRVSSLYNQEQELFKSIGDLKQEKYDLSSKVLEEIDKYNIDKKHNEDYLTKIRLDIDTLNKEYVELSDNLLNATLKLSKTIEDNNLENITLSRRKRDLEIYELRLRKKYPNDNIILQ